MPELAEPSKSCFAGDAVGKYAGVKWTLDDAETWWLGPARLWNRSLRAKSYDGEDRCIGKPVD